MTKRTPANIPASVRQKLLNIAHREVQENQTVLVRYGFERLLYRLSVSRHRGAFVLKGAMLFKLWCGQMHRTTRDLDLSGAADNTIPGLENVFREVCTQSDPSDGIVFLADSVAGEEIRQDQEYQGVCIRIEARLGKMRIPLHVDIGFGDAIVPAAEEAEFPTLLDMPAPRMKVYPRETVVAEKFHAQVLADVDPMNLM